jgi:hypothetical protein
LIRTWTYLDKRFGFSNLGADLGVQDHALLHEPSKVAVNRQTLFLGGYISDTLSDLHSVSAIGFVSALSRIYGHWDPTPHRHAQSRGVSEISVIGDGGYRLEITANSECAGQNGRPYRERFGCVVANCLPASQYAPVSTFDHRHMSVFGSICLC